MIAILKYNAGNTTSLLHCLYRLGYDEKDIIVSDNPETIRSADKVLFPGVGAAGSALKYIRDRKLDELILSLEQPFMGICLGMQVMCSYCEEDNSPGLGVFPCSVNKIGGPVKVPHMGWNTLSGMTGVLFENIIPSPDLYFVHSYSAEVCANTVAQSSHGANFSAALQKDNFYGVQFHPEKSGENGEVILKNFLEI